MGLIGHLGCPSFAHHPTMGQLTTYREKVRRTLPACWLLFAWQKLWRRKKRAHRLKPENGKPPSDREKLPGEEEGPRDTWEIERWDSVYERDSREADSTGKVGHPARERQERSLSV